MKKILLRASLIIAGIALAITALCINNTCLFLIYQPKIPVEALRLRRL